MSESKINSKIVGLDGKPLNGSKPHVRRGVPVVFRTPDLPTEPEGLEKVASHIESLGVATPADAFTVAILRALATALKRIEALENPDA